MYRLILIVLYIHPQRVDKILYAWAHGYDLVFAELQDIDALIARVINVDSKRTYI